MSEWISVDDRLPEETFRVVVYANDEFRFWVDAVSAYVCPEYGNVIWEHLNGEDYPHFVTHWMPLPEPPNE